MVDWSVTKARLNEKIAKIIGDDLLMEEKHAELVTRLEKRLGKNRAAILKILSDL